MNKEQLMKTIDSHNLLRTMGFPMIMPLVKGFDGSWKEARTTIEQIVALHISSKYERILKELGIYVNKGDLQEAWTELIKRDFFDKGFVRENITKEALENLEGVESVRFSTAEEETKGIDLIWIEDGDEYAGSVKGYHYDTTEYYPAHLNKLKLSIDDYKDVYIFFVDEKGRKVLGRRVKK